MADMYDVVIVGSGAGGAASAWALTQLGYKVLILEAGPKYDPFKDYKASQANWEDGFPFKDASQGRYSYDVSQPLRMQHSHLRSWNHISGRLNSTNERVSFGYHHLRAVGGSSLVYTGEAHRLNPKSMKMFSDHGVAADWPLSYDDLEPFYQEAEQVLGVAGPANEPSRPRSRKYPYEAHSPSYVSQFLGKSFNKLGLSWVANSLAVLPQPRDGRLPCNYCGSCQKGCPRADKGTMDVSYLKDAQDTKLCDVISGVVVTKILTDSERKIKGVVYRDQNGKQNSIETPLLIVSAGAIETPRLLLMSADASSPNGLGNESGHVGKNFMETILWTSTGVVDQDIGSHRGLPVDSICWDYNQPTSIPGVIGGCRFSPSVAESDLLGPVNYSTRVVPGWGKAHKNQMRLQFGRAVSITGISESLPNEKSYVSLDLNQKDQFGMPIAKINSYLDDMAVRRIDFMAKMARKILKTSGVKRIIEEFSSYDIFSSTHVFGTCRMGLDKHKSVVNQWCQSHRWKNLFIIDASVFPSSGGGESPSLTIQALALRSAQYIHREFYAKKS